jgi:hypothetical protein
LEVRHTGVVHVQRLHDAVIIDRANG